MTTLSELLAAGADSVAAIIYDPETVARAYELGLGATGSFSIGGKLSEGGAPPLQFHGTVKKLFDGDYELIGTPYGGLRSPLGATALVSDGGIDIIVTSKRIYPQPSALLAVMNVDGSAKRGIVVKDTCATSTLNPREVMNVDTPGLTIWDFAKVPYRKVQRPRFPMDDIAEPF